MLSHRERVRVAALVVAFFALAVVSRPLLLYIGPYHSLLEALPDSIRWLEQPLRWTLLCLIGLRVIHGLPLARMPRELGMASPLRPGLVVPFVACLPMLIVPALAGSVSRDLDWQRGVLFGAVVWPLGEEILFRGFAFRQLYQRAALGLWPAAIGVGVVFGVAHLGQASVRGLPLAQEIGAVAIVSLGGILFSWLYARWDDNLWVPFGAHLFMNLWWTAFDLADSPLGGWVPNLLRAASVLLLVLMTVYRDRLPGLQVRPSAGP